MIIKIVNLNAHTSLLSDDPEHHVKEHRLSVLLKWNIIAVFTERTGRFFYFFFRMVISEGKTET